MEAADGPQAFARVLALLDHCAAHCRIHDHAPTRTMDEARANLDFDPGRIVKTIAFSTRDGRLVLAALRGTRRVDYPLLAARLGLRRRDLASLSPAELLASLGVEPGSVAPLDVWGGAEIVVDQDVLSIAPTAYCGSGRPDRTLEMEPAELVRLAGGGTGSFSRQAEPEG